MEKYEPLRKIAEGLYCVDGDWQGTPFGRRMTVIALKSGKLVIHSAIRMSDADMAALDELGRVATIVAPNIHHGSDAQWYGDHYSAAKILVPYDAGGKLRKLTRIDGTVEDNWPKEYEAELAYQPMLGTRVHEVALFHRPSRTLILTDSVFNLADSDFKPGWFKRLMKWNGIVGRFGPSRFFQTFHTVDRFKLRDSLRSVEEWDFDRIIMSHGKIEESGGKQLLHEAFAPIFARMPVRPSDTWDNDDHGHEVSS